MDQADIASHYGSAGLGRALLSALEAAFGEALDAKAMRGVDQFHLGGHRATEAVLGALELGTDAHVLDVGCGIGGVARDIRAHFGCSVTAVDITPEFIEAAGLLSDRVRSHDGITFEVADALDLPYSEACFDAAVVVHVGMNISDKAALVTQLRRVVRPAAPILVYDIVRRTNAPLAYPLPWTGSEATDFIATEGAYIEAMAASGLELRHVVDRTDLVLEVIELAAANPGPVSLANLMGTAWPVMFGNLVSALREGTVAPVEIVAVA